MCPRLWPGGQHLPDLLQRLGRSLRIASLQHLDGLSPSSTHTAASCFRTFSSSSAEQVFDEQAAGRPDVQVAIALGSNLVSLQNVQSGELRVSVATIYQYKKSNININIG